MDIGYSIQEGIKRAKRNWSLIFLIFGANLVLALIVAMPLKGLIESGIGTSGFGDDLVRSFDAGLWADIMEKIGPAIQGYFFPQLFWVALVYLIWKVVLSLGLIARLREESLGFWEGVSHYFFRGLGVGAFYFFFTVLGLIMSFAIFTTLATLGGEVAAFWVGFVAMPFVMISWVAMLDLMHDYARIHLVERDSSVFRSIFKGFVWPFKNGSASWLYWFWFLLSMLAWGLPFLFDINTASATSIGIIGLLLVQQLMLLIKSAFSLAWFGSEVAFFERRAPAPVEEIEYIDSRLPDEAFQPSYDPETLRHPGDEGLV